jgi:C-terminal processing protease CtpA/Prc
LFRRNDNDPPLQDFVDSAETLRNEPVLIIDLRGHSGGNDEIARQWVERYTGQSPCYSKMFTHFRLNSLTTDELTPWMIPMSPPQWSTTTPCLTCGFIQNENLVIVLTDNAVSSAGDTFVGFLRQLENVLFVGLNTRGVSVAGNVPLQPPRLPHSGLTVSFGVSLSVRNDLSQFEGVGFKPDLWVPPGQSLERVLKFIERYGIGGQ